MKKQRNSRKTNKQTNIYFFIDYTKAFDYVDHNKLLKILKKMGIPDHVTCLLRDLYAGKDAIVRTRHGKTDLFRTGKGVCQGYILSSCLFYFYAESASTVSSIAQSCLTLCDPMNCSMPGLTVHHKLPEFTQTHAHRVNDAIQPSYPLSSPYPPTPNPSQHQVLFQ